jgi:hypothetical protein
MSTPFLAEESASFSAEDVLSLRVHNQEQSSTLDAHRNKLRSCVSHPLGEIKWHSTSSFRTLLSLLMCYSLYVLLCEWQLYEPSKTSPSKNFY